MRIDSSLQSKYFDRDFIHDGRIRSMTTRALFIVKGEEKGQIFPSAIRADLKKK
uniref:Uncharacterized protein n=1 Tax=Candidatus Kentrum sp. SD TaxID=2126332 RepID=A0A450YF34_9GAMM|nr:MAG: hypothetical protein BECKSD772F_GA0070984_105512 [Candidatus Kentron sp. SD]VFK45508.1 MAG: hypothetical protein BECKSD772E_GA0070983_10557 [Candidatus Kentron sp. SD]